MPAGRPNGIPNVDSILAFVGREKVRVEEGRLVKADPRVQLDFNSIAKGYTVDLLARLVESFGARNYIVDIGGEVRCKGVNRQGGPWRIGIETPFDGNMSDGEYVQKRIRLTDGGLATSGNYRRFYLDADGNKVAHTIDPRTGRSAVSRLLSVTVAAPTCAEADALGTMFLAMGADDALEAVRTMPGREGLFHPRRRGRRLRRVYFTRHGGDDHAITIPMKSAVFLYNTQSGKCKIERCTEAVCTVFRAYGYDIKPQLIDFGANPFDGNEQIDLMVVAGGDGTVNYVVNTMKNKGLDIPLGVIPAGTANDFAGALGMSRHPLEAARQIASGAVDRVDCGCVNGLYFVNIFSFGIFTTTSQRTPDQRKHKIGKLAYLIEGVKELRAMHAVPLKVVADGQAFDFNSLMVLVFNGETAGGFRLARRSSVKDGLFDCIMLEKKNFLRSTLAMGRYLLRGNPKIVRHLRVRSLDIVSTVNEPTDVDGQKGAEFPLHIECIAGGLRIMCPRGE